MNRVLRCAAVLAVVTGSILVATDAKACFFGGCGCRRQSCCYQPVVYQSYYQPSCGCNSCGSYGGGCSSCSYGGGYGGYYTAAYAPVYAPAYAPVYAPAPAYIGYAAPYRMDYRVSYRARW